ncbi:MAG: hypothetical protein EP330_09090 [Deltaproteobacteria bacterium]|nr:MAG: hypothetical protein EP330_09090 [Deltaproteobacteria bacterium]
MTRVFQGNDPVEPYLLRDWLARNGVAVQLRGASLLGVVGGIPIPKSFPTLWVPEYQKLDAERLIAQFSGPALVHPEWECKQCGEINAPSFGSCWNCQAEAP